MCECNNGMLRIYSRIVVMPRDTDGSLVGDISRGDLYLCRINGTTHINLTKLDVLSGIGDLKLGVAYNLADGKQTTTMPARVEDLENVTVEYETLPGWEEDIMEVSAS